MRDRRTDHHGGGGDEDEDAAFGRALGDPAAAFAGPEDVVAHPSLSRERKRELLERWRTGLGEAGGGSGGGGTPPAGGVLERIGRALAFLDTETGGRKQTHEGVLHGPGMAPDVGGGASDKDGGGGGAAPAGGGKRG